jgi:Zinc finger, C2H2 type
MNPVSSTCYQCRSPHVMPNGLCMPCAKTKWRELKKTQLAKANASLPANNFPYICTKCFNTVSSYNIMCPSCKKKEMRQQLKELNASLPTGDDTARLTRQPSPPSSSHNRPSSTAQKPNIPNDNSAEASSSTHHQTRNSNNGHNRPPVPPPFPSTATDDFACNICSKKFKTKLNAQKHVKTVHEGLRPFVCEKCKAEFGDKSGLNRHVKAFHEKTTAPVPDSVHKKIRPFKCTQCPASFGQKAHLNNHIKTVHENKREFACSLCSASFGRMHKLSTHLKLIHGEEPSATNSHQ